MLELLPD
jgi:hypothetical protein